jgi:hypothetical protein
VQCQLLHACYSRELTGRGQKNEIGQFSTTDLNKTDTMLQDDKGGGGENTDLWSRRGVGGRGGRGSVKFASCKMHGAFTSDTPKHGHSMVICDMDKFNT